MTERPPTFTLHTDPATGAETITVDYWPDRLLISEAVLRTARPAYLRRRADEVTIRCANGEATYRIEACDATETYHAVAVRRSWWGARSP